MQNKRIESLDVLRGIALIFIILFHSSIYNYANIHKIDFSNPPILIVLMSFMALWGGIFIVYSSVVGTISLLEKNKNNFNPKLFLYPVIAGIIYLIFHYILTIILGRWNNDFVNNKPDMTLIASSIRTMSITFPHITKFFEGSSLSTIALNLISLSGILYLLLKNNGILKAKRNYSILAVSGILIMVLSFLRVSIFPLFTQSIESNNYLLATFFSFTIANPYPLLPYLAYGIFGILIGMMIYQKQHKLLLRIVVPIGILFLIYGFYGMMNFSKTISKPDYFWYFKTNFELGIFILALIFFVLFLGKRTKFLNKLSVIKWFSRVSLTIYMLETTVSEIFRYLWFAVIPDWNQTINGCLLFGAMNIVIWIIILFIWEKYNFKFSLEYYWVRLFNKFGGKSTKMDCLVK